MSVSTLTRPISVEQVATIIKQMSQVELQRLLYLVPNLEQKKPAKRPTRTLEQAQASVDALWAEIKADPNYKPIPRDTPFLGGYTLGEFLALPDETIHRACNGQYVTTFGYTSTIFRSYSSLFEPC